MTMKELKQLNDYSQVVELKKKLSKWSNKQLEKELRPLLSEINANVEALNEKGYIPPSYEYIKQRGGSIEMPNKEMYEGGQYHNALVKTFSEAIYYSRLKTNTVEGYEKFAKSFNERMGFKYTDRVHKWSKNRQKDFWSMVEKVKTSDEARSWGSERVQSTVAERIEQARVDNPKYTRMGKLDRRAYLEKYVMPSVTESYEEKEKQRLNKLKGNDRYDLTVRFPEDF